MKWFNHSTTDGCQGPLAMLVAELGYEGYGVYWRLMELLASMYDEKSDGTFVFPRKDFGNFFGFSRGKIEKFLQTFAELQLFSIKFSEKTIVFEVPNLAEIQDDYTRDKSKNLEESSK